MPRTVPEDLVESLHPGRRAILKLEDRTVVWRETGSAGTPVVVKLYRRRGGWTAFRSRIFRFRTEREFRRLRHLVRWNIPCTPPLGWAAGRSPEHGHHEILLMEEVPAARELGTYMGEYGSVDLAPLFRMVRRMHESGFCHQTLYAANVLVVGEDPERASFVMCDVPRSWTFPQSIAGTSMARYDLLDLAASLVDAGVRPEALPLDAYDVQEGARVLQRLRGGEDPRGKRRRFLRDLMARVRWAGAWAAFWRRRQHPPPASRGRREDAIGRPLVPGP